MADNSYFRFDTRGFMLLTSGKFYSWAAIEEISAYKLDLMTTDEIRLDISFQKVVLTLSEEQPGFPDFIEELKKALPGIMVDWETKVVLPPFATNLTVIYKKQ